VKNGIELEELKEALLAVLPPARRWRIARILQDVERQKGWSGVVRRLEKDWDIWRGGPVKVLFVGSSNSGKSTLIHQLFGKRGTRSEVFSVLEVPGIDEYLGYGRDADLLRSASSADLVVLVLDAGLKPTDATERTVQSIEQLKIPLLVVLNKLDQVADPRAVLEEYRRGLKRSVLGVSFRDFDSLRELLRRILTVQPRILFSIAREHPQYREILVQHLLEESSLVTAALASMTQSIDAHILTALVQSTVFLKMRRVYGKPFDRAAALELAGSVTAAVAFESALCVFLPKVGFRKKMVGMLAAGAGIFFVGKLLQRYYQKEQNDSFAPKEAA
jgi:ribosome-interacting GTPase 1